MFCEARKDSLDDDCDIDRVQVRSTDGGKTWKPHQLVYEESGNAKIKYGNRHARENLPILLAGRAGDTVKSGRHIDFNWKKLTPVANLYVEMLKRVGVPAEKFGDSTGGLPQLG